VSCKELVQNALTLGIVPPQCHKMLRHYGLEVLHSKNINVPRFLAAKRFIVLIF